MAERFTLNGLLLSQQEATALLQDAGAQLALRRALRRQQQAAQQAQGTEIPACHGINPGIQATLANDHDSERENKQGEE